MSQSEAPADIFVPFAALTQRLAALFRAAGTSPEVADILAGNMAAAERDGIASHGLFRLPGYLATLASGGWVDGKAVPQVKDAGAAFVAVDAANGFAQPALRCAAPLATRKARETGACVVTIRRSHHFGALSLDVEPFAERGLIALALVNTMAAVVPPGGTAPVYGTNPMAFAAPRAGGVLLFDQAVSPMAHGEVQIAAREGRVLADGVGVDRQGQPTRDPAAMLDGGGLLPFGGHKGASIALMIEIMAAALTGGAFSFEVDWSAYPGAQTPCTGQCLILIDPSRTGPLSGFTARVETLLAALARAGQGRIPGERRLTARAASDRNGIRLSPAIAAQLTTLERDLASRRPYPSQSA